MAPPSLLYRLRTFFGGGHDVFLSYARADGADYAKQLEALLSPRYSVFRDASTLVAGESIPVELAEHAARSSVFLLVGTPRAYESSWVAQEISAYLNARKRPRLLRVVFPGVGIPDTQPHKDVLADTLGIEALAPATQPPGERVVEGIRRHFDVVTQRVRRRLTAATILISLIATALAVRAELSARERDARIEKWLSKAQLSEEVSRYDSAEWAFANAWWESNRAREDIRRGYLRARERRTFDRLEFRSEPGELAHAVADGPDGPMVITQRAGMAELSVRMGELTSRIPLDDAETVFDVSIREGWILVECLERAWIQPARVGSTGQWLDGLHGVTSVLLTKDTVTFLLHAEGGLALRAYQLPSLGNPDETTVDLPANTSVTTCELLDDGTLFVAGDQRGTDGGWVPTVWLRRPGLDQWFELSFERELSLIAQCSHAYVGNGGQVACLALRPMDFSGSGAPTPARQLYTRLEDDFGLAWLAHTGDWTPELVDPGPIDVVFRTASGDLKWLERPSIILTQVEPKTLARDVSSFLIWTRPTEGLPNLVVATTDGNLDFYREGTVWSRISLPQGPARILSDQHYRLLLVDTDEEIRLWRVSEAGDGVVPDLATLRGSLPPEATTASGDEWGSLPAARSERERDTER